jgi:hypothetical protein
MGFFRPETQRCTMGDFRLPPRSRRRRAQVSDLNQLLTRVKKKTLSNFIREITVVIEITFEFRL